ncbi:hypothetical protein GJA_1015 [Janthinobacterium agaricidamnosum NBRC 102515 = DSM 9628]|uniref:Uncharacterized protein n=2 Tax=Janthinobacterium agaricidamnosum TaxID=55508 RepID=W0V223_9BURK|nr:hypothetical protein GJA_1015 [Janthinobacterium agaricidamnosum NBRC 102515 = DSM 9628]
MLMNYLLTRFGNGKTKVEQALFSRQRAGGAPPQEPTRLLHTICF